MNAIALNPGLVLTDITTSGNGRVKSLLEALNRAVPAFWVSTAGQGILVYGPQLALVANSQDNPS